MENRKRVIIVGGGFGGIQLARCIDKKLFDVMLIDKINHHQFQPLFYQVATSQIEPSSISFPFRHIFRKNKGLLIRLANVTRIDTANNHVITNIGDFEYDILILGIGCKTNFFGNEAIAEHSFTLKTTYDAIKIRNHILQTFEKIISAKEEDKEALLNLVIVGAGPTGVELAGAFTEIKKNILPKDYPRIDFSKFNIILIEGSDVTLGSMSRNAKRASRKYLEDMGTQLIMEKFVKSYDGTSLKLSDGREIKTKSVIWAAGVTGNKLEGLDENSYVKGNRLKVNRMNRVEGYDNVYAIGDIAFMQTPKYPNGHPQVANVAINQGKLLARNLKLMELGKSTKEYEYIDLGAMATIGRNKSVVDLPFIKFDGYFAWFIWMFFHLMLILSVRNKLIIFINWAWTYITKDSSLRLILNDSDQITNYADKTSAISTSKVVKPQKPKIVKQSELHH